MGKFPSDYDGVRGNDEQRTGEFSMITKQQLWSMGVHCYESTARGDLILWVCGKKPEDDSIKVTIEHNDLSRLLAAVGSAMLKKEGRR